MSPPNCSYDVPSLPHSRWSDPPLQTLPVQTDHLGCMRDCHSRGKISYSLRTCSHSSFVLASRPSRVEKSIPYIPIRKLMQYIMDEGVAGWDCLAQTSSESDDVLFTDNDLEWDPMTQSGYQCSFLESQPTCLSPSTTFMEPFGSQDLISRSSSGSRPYFSPESFVSSCGIQAPNPTIFDQLGEDSYLLQNGLYQTPPQSLGMTTAPMSYERPQRYRHIKPKIEEAATLDSTGTQEISLDQRVQCPPKKAQANVSPKPSDLATKTGKFKCGCGETFSDHSGRENRLRHQKSSCRLEKKKRITCSWPRCNKIYARSDALRKHFNKHHIGECKK